MNSLREAFLEAVPPTWRPSWEALSPLESALSQAHAEGAARWPTVAVAAARFARYLAARVEGEPPRQGDPFPHASELYLACAIVDRQAGALAAFERDYLPAIPSAVARFRLSPDQLDEVRQTLRRQLLLHDGQRPARLADWSGRGPLAAWLRVAAVRAAIKLRRGPADAQVELDALERLADAHPSPEAAAMAAQGRASLRAALAQAIRTLAPREQTVLRQHYLDELTLDQLAALHRVHRTTVAYWVERAAERLLKRTRQALAFGQKLSSSDCDSLLRHARSQLNTSLRGLFLDGNE
jgi:RNA polymerase sigma-70 factor (ECF subfamily)